MRQKVSLGRTLVKEAHHTTHIEGTRLTLDQAERFFQVRYTQNYVKWRIIRVERMCRFGKTATGGPNPLC